MQIFKYSEIDAIPTFREKTIYVLRARSSWRLNTSAFLNAFHKICNINDAEMVAMIQSIYIEEQYRMMQRISNEFFNTQSGKEWWRGVDDNDQPNDIKLTNIELSSFVSLSVLVKLQHKRTQKHITGHWNNMSWDFIHIFAFGYFFIWTVSLFLSQFF